MARTKRIDLVTCAFWCLTLSIALLPIGLGGNRPIPLGLAQAGLASCCLFVASNHDVWAEVQFFGRLRWAIGLFAVVMLWAFFQTQPYIPASWVHPLWQESAVVLKVPVRGTISVSPEDSLKCIADFLTYMTAGLLAYVLCQNPKRAKKLVKTIWIVGTAICAYGLATYALGLNKILWFDKWAYFGDLTGTFVNRNHFAIYAGMVMVCGAALTLQSWEKDVQRHKPHYRVRAMRDWLTQKGFLYTFMLAMVFLCIIFSHSRAGLVLTILGLGSYFFFHQIYMGAWKRAITIVVCCFIALIVALLIATQFSDRFGELFKDYSSLDRLHTYKIGWHALRDNPWLGYGLGGFEPEFRLYQQYMIMEFNHAHSDVLESLIDLGVPVALMLWTGIALLLGALWHGIRRRRQNGIFPALALAVSLMALGHAFVDFDLQIPGIVLTWVTILGIGLSQSWTQAERRAHVESGKH